MSDHCKLIYCSRCGNPCGDGSSLVGGMCSFCRTYLLAEQEFGQAQRSVSPSGQADPVGILRHRPTVGDLIGVAVCLGLLAWAIVALAQEGARLDDKIGPDPYGNKVPGLGVDLGPVEGTD